MKGAPGSSETSVLTRATRRYNPEDTILCKALYSGMHKIVSRALLQLKVTKLVMENANFWDVSRADLVRNDILEERSASIIRVTRIGEIATTIALTSNRRTLRRNNSSAVRSSSILLTLMIEALSSFETVLTRTTRHNIPDDGILHSHRHENFKSYIGLLCFMGIIFKEKNTLTTITTVDVIIVQPFIGNSTFPRLNSTSIFNLKLSVGPGRTSLCLWIRRQRLALQFSRFHLKTETRSSLRNVEF
jgi:hypothetical protein